MCVSHCHSLQVQNDHIVLEWETWAWVVCWGLRLRENPREAQAEWLQSSTSVDKERQASQCVPVTYPEATAEPKRGEATNSKTDTPVEVGSVFHWWYCV